MDKKINNTSKFLSYILRHNPQEIDLTLDHEGWANINELIEQSNRNGKCYDRNLIDLVVKTNKKKRFSISSCGKKIRANQGHSIDIDLGLEEKQPPDILLHGTAERFLESIRQEGLTKQNRHQVHLTDDAITAKAVGRRHGKSIILQVDAQSMAKEGFKFFCSDNGVWLVENVPPRFIVSTCY